MVVASEAALVDESLAGDGLLHFGRALASNPSDNEEGNQCQENDDAEDDSDNGSSVRCRRVTFMTVHIGGHLLQCLVAHLIGYILDRLDLIFDVFGDLASFCWAKYIGVDGDDFGDSSNDIGLDNALVLLNLRPLKLATDCFVDACRSIQYLGIDRAQCVLDLLKIAWIVCNDFD